MQVAGSHPGEVLLLHHGNKAASEGSPGKAPAPALAEEALVRHVPGTQPGVVRRPPVLLQMSPKMSSS